MLRLIALCALLAMSQQANAMKDFPDDVPRGKVVWEEPWVLPAVRDVAVRLDPIQMMPPLYPTRIYGGRDFWDQWHEWDKVCPGPQDWKDLMVGSRNQ